MMIMRRTPKQGETRLFRASVQFIRVGTVGNDQAKMYNLQRRNLMETFSKQNVKPSGT